MEQWRMRVRNDTHHVDCWCALDADWISVIYYHEGPFTLGVVSELSLRDV